MVSENAPLEVLAEFEWHARNGSRLPFVVHTLDGAWIRHRDGRIEKMSDDELAHWRRARMFARMLNVMDGDHLA